MKPLLTLLLCAALTPPTSAQQTAPRFAPTRSVVRKLPSPFEAKPVPGASQEPAADDLDADAAAVFRPREDIEPADVVLSNGEVRVERSDLFILGRAGLNFELRRRYRSQLDYKGPLGYGWDFNYNEQLYDGTGGAKIRLNGAGHVDTWTRNGDGSFNAPAGFFGTLVENSDATFTLREPGGMKHHYKRNGFLSALEDRHGNRISFYYSEGRLVSATDVFGRLIRFFFEASPDGRQRLARVRDFTGREIVYTYDTSGDLVAARSPIITGTSTGNDFPDGTTERYSYHDDHNLHEVTFPNEVAAAGPPAMVYTYDDEDRVTAWMLGGTNASGVPAGGTATFAYAAQNVGSPLGDPTLARLRTTVVERNGNSYDVDVNELQHRIQSRRFTRGLRPGEPAFYLTRWEHDADGQVTRLIRPRGNGALYAYDTSGPRAARRNLIEWRRVSDAVNLAGPEEDLVWTYAYDPIYQIRVQATDPRENSPSFVPPIGSNAPGRYTSHWYVDYQEGDGPIPDAAAFGLDPGSFPRNLGDLNADGSTDQTAGNVVRHEGAAVTLEAGSPLALAIGSTTQEIVTETWWNDYGQRTGEIDPEGNLTEWDYFSADAPAGPGGPAPLGLPEGGYLSRIREDAGMTYRRTTGEAPLALTTELRPNQRGTVTEETNPRGVRTDTEVNAHDQVVSRIRGADISQASPTLLLIDGGPFQYREEVVRDANGNVYAYRKENRPAVSASDVGQYLDLSGSHDILNRPIEEGHEVDTTTTAVTRRTYDASGNQTGITYPEGNEERFSFDERNLLYQRTPGFGSPVAGNYMYGYDDDGNPRDRTDAEDTDGDGQPEQTSYEYSPFDWFEGTTEPLGVSGNYTFDPASNRLTAVKFGHPPGDPAGTPVRVGETHWNYDEQNRMFRSDELRFLPAGTATVRPVDTGDGARTTRYQFDATGNLRFATNDRGWSLELRYDGARRLIEELDALGNTVRCDLDGNGNVICMTETDVQPDGLLANRLYSTTFSHDQLDREVRRVDSGGSATYTAWDSLGNISATWDARGSLLGTDPWGVFPKPGQTGSLNDHGNLVQLTWNGLGLKIRADYDLNEAGEAANGPDSDNIYNPDARSTNLYGHDLNGRQVSQTDDVGNTTRWAYSTRDWITNSTLANGAIITISYDLDGNETGKSLPNGWAVAYGLDGRNRRISELRTAAPVGQVAGVFSKAFAYDGQDHVIDATSITYSSSPPPPSLTVTYQRAYDSLGDLVEETVTGPLTTSFTRDGVGNVTGMTLPDDRVISTTFDPRDRPRSLDCSLNGPIVTGAYYFGRHKLMLRQDFGNGTVRTNQFDDRREMTGTQHALPPSAGGTPFVDNGWMRSRLGSIVSETRGVTGQDRSFEIGSTGSLDASIEPTIRTNFLRQGNAILRSDVLVDMTGSYPLNYNVDQLGAHTSADGFGQGRDAIGNQLNRTQYNFRYDYDQRLILVDLNFVGPLKEFFYHADGRQALSVRNIFGVVSFVHSTWSHDDHVLQDWLDDNGTWNVARTYYHFNDELVALDESPTHFTGDQAFILHQDPRSGTQARTFLHRADYMANGFWDFGHSDTTAGGLELLTFPVTETYQLPGKRYDRNLGVVHTDDHGGAYFHDTQRLGARKLIMPGATGSQHELGNGYNPFASGNSVSEVTHDPADFPVHCFEIERGLHGNCQGNVHRQGKDEVDNLQFVQILERYYTEVTRPRAGDIVVFGTIPDSLPSDPLARGQAVAGISHVALVAHNDRKGVVSTLGRGRTLGPVEFADARAHGTEIRYFHRLGGGLEEFDRVKAETLVRQVQRLIDQGADATPVVDVLLDLLQVPNTIPGPLPAGFLD